MYFFYFKINFKVIFKINQKSFFNQIIAVRKLNDYLFVYFYFYVWKKYFFLFKLIKYLFFKFKNKLDFLKIN